MALSIKIPDLAFPYVVIIDIININSRTHSIVQDENIKRSNKKK